MEHAGVRASQNGLKQIKVTRNTEEDHEGEHEPLSPIARMFHEPGSNVYILFSLGFKDPLDPQTLKANLLATVLKHPRFSSVQIADEKNGGLKWVQTEVDLDNHIIVVPKQDMETKAADKFVEDYMANLSKTNLSMSIPMWDAHILNLKTSDGAESHLMFRVHHSLGDGTSFISLLLSCSRKLSDPHALPTFPIPTKKPTTSSTLSRRLIGVWIRFWSTFLLLWNTLIDMLLCVATMYFLKDTQTPLKAPSAAVAFTSRRIVRQTFSLPDVKFVKNATKTTVNDVLVAITEAALSRYLNRKYGMIIKKKESAEWENNLPKNIRFTTTLFMNLRSSPGIHPLDEMMKRKSKAEWGNKIGYVIFPFTIELKDNPLDHIREVKARMDRKKASLEAKFRYFMATVFLRFYRTKLAIFPATTMWFSNVPGPQDKISLFGNEVVYVAPSLFGQPVSLTINIVSYADTISMILAVDENIIPDVYQLCDDLEESLKLLKKSVVAEGLNN